jgi:hypothetical protein
MAENKEITGQVDCLRGHPRTPENLYGRSCKICARETTRASDRRRRKRNPALYLFKQLRRNAKKRGQEFTITLADLMPFPKSCPVLGIELNYTGVITRDRNNWLSIDRRDSKKGYVPGNVQIISYRANRIKCDSTVEEVEKLLAWMKNPCI